MVLIYADILVLVVATGIKELGKHVRVIRIYAIPQGSQFRREV